MDIISFTKLYQHIIKTIKLYDFVQFNKISFCALKQIRKVLAREKFNVQFNPY